MTNVKFTKNELKRQKDNLKRFTRYLPTLELKKQQLLLEIRNIQHRLDTIHAEILQTEAIVRQWADVFAEEINLAEYVQMKEIKKDTGNIAGIDIPLYCNVVFEERDYDLLSIPLWVDQGIAVVKDQMQRKVEMSICDQQIHILREELRVTIQRIKLFEEVKIPEARENIRIIQIFIGDQMTAEVVRGKIAKAKIEKKKRAGIQL
jgi:V/A-type H+-transporting ATPase subunit D